VYPGIRRLCQSIEVHAYKMEPHLAEVYNQVSGNLRQLCLENPPGLFQLAYVLTPNGRLEA
jgi:hypothetical protein